MLAEMQFKGVWRTYQERVLAEMDGHLADGRLHIVAAPGSGKTILGLEAMRRIGRPALILAPNLTIREQWRDRLFPLFLDDPHAWDAAISRDVEAPATLTIATYQALYACHADGAARFDAMIGALAAIGPITLIVDEAHHLRRAWWQALFALRARLPGAKLIALTATPPYDAALSEWGRYEALCGPIDSEIAVPELVRNGDLCPHQDHIHLSRPRDEEQALLIARRQAIEALVAGLVADTVLIDRIAGHPWMVDPQAHEEQLFARPEYLTALLILLHAAGRPIPPAVTDLLGVGGAALPQLTAKWLEQLFQGLLDEPNTKLVLGDARWTDLRGALKRLGLIENKRVTLRENKAVFTAIAGSITKLHSIVDIVRAEADTLGDRLRLVILTDRVRVDDLPRSPDAPFAPAKLGVVPIFEALRRTGVMTSALAVLTGNLVVLPAAAAGALDDEIAALRLDPARLQSRALSGCPGHMALDADGDETSALVALVTRLFQRGVIRVLVGTQALLGEGWDAPALNSLILASNTGAYMLSNQMRGRAIRIDPEQPDKVAAIWHLATIMPGLDDGEEDLNQSAEVGLLARRFTMFEGIANDASRLITNGIDRLAVDFVNTVEAENTRTLAGARDRAGVAAKWRAALGDATPRSHVRRVAELNYAPRRLAVRDTLQALVLSGVGGGALSAAGAVRQFAGGGGLVTALMVFAGATLLYGLPKLAQAALLWWRNGTLERSLAEVGAVLIESLSYIGALAQDRAAYTVIVTPTLSGRYEVMIDGASRADERVVLNALAELLGPLQNPRYLLVRRSRLWRAGRVDYHAVPAVLGGRKEHAEYFHRQWRRRIGQSLLIYAHNGAGRRVLLRARVQSFAAGFQRFYQWRSVWM